MRELRAQAGAVDVRDHAGIFQLSLELGNVLRGCGVGDTHPRLTARLFEAQVGDVGLVGNNRVWGHAFDGLECEADLLVANREVDLLAVVLLGVRSVTHVHGAGFGQEARVTWHVLGGLVMRVDAHNLGQGVVVFIQLVPQRHGRFGLHAREGDEVVHGVRLLDGVGGLARGRRRHHVDRVVLVEFVVGGGAGGLRPHQDGRHQGDAHQKRRGR